MSDSVKGIVVAFEQDIREEYVEKIIDAIKLLRYVVSVSPSIANADDFMNREQVRWQLRRELWDVLNPKKGGDA